MLFALTCTAQPFYKFTGLNINQPQISAAYTKDSGFITSNMVKYTAVGDTQWSKLYTQLETSKIIETADSGFALTGKTANYAVTNESTILIKTNKNGLAVWAKSYDIGFKSIGKVLRQTFDGGYIIAAASNKPSLQNDIILIKTNNLGDTLWVKRYEFNNTTNVEDAIQTPDSGYIVVGASNGTALTKTLFFRLTSTGGIVWSKEVFSGIPIVRNIETARNIIELPNGYMITTNLSDSNTTKGNVIAIYKVDLNGNILSAKQAGIAFGYGIESQYSTLTKDGIILTVGKVNPYNDKTSTTMVALKTDTSGNVIWLHAYGSRNYFSNLFFGRENADTTCTLIGTAMISPTETGLSYIRTDKNGALPCQDTDFAKVGINASYTVSNISVIVKPNPLTVQSFIPINVSGCTTKTICIYAGVNNTINEDKTLLYPNPNNGSFILKFKSDHHMTGYIEIKNVLGQSVYKQTVIIAPGTNTIPINTELKNSLYLFTITYSDTRLTQLIQVED
jgi:hypothetical protein